MGEMKPLGTEQKRQPQYPSDTVRKKHEKGDGFSRRQPGSARQHCVSLADDSPGHLLLILVCPQATIAGLQDFTLLY